MNISLKRFFNKILFFTFCFLVSSNYVIAFDNQKGTNNVFVNCNDVNHCIPLCVYGDEAMIGIYYDGAYNDWEIAFKSGNKVKYSKTSNYIPKTDIFAGEPNQKKGDEWKNSNLYNDLNSGFKCPSYFFPDSASGLFIGDNEICFSNSLNSNSLTSCNIHNDAVTSFIDPTSITYRFTEEFEKVVSQAYEKSRDLFADYSNNVDLEKIKFLKTFDDGYSFDDKLSADQNARNNCEYLKSKADGKYEEYINSFANEEYQKKYITNYIDPMLNRIAKENNVKDVSVYTFEKLYKLTNGKSIGMYNAEANLVEKSNKPMLQMFFPNAFNKTVKDSINYIDAYCNDVANVSIDTRVDSDGDGVLDTDSMNAKIDSGKVSFELKLFKDPKIDIDNQVTYDCSFLTDVADIISNGYFILEMAGLAILVVLSIFDYVKIFLNDNADELNKANSKFVKRLIVAVLLFLLPAFVNLALRIFKIEGVDSDHPLCVQISNK